MPLRLRLLTLPISLSLALFACFGDPPLGEPPGSAAPLRPEPGERLKVYALFPTPHENEPWPRAVHQALRRAADHNQIDYGFEGALGYDRFEQALEDAAKLDYDILVGDGFGQEEEVRRVAAKFPTKAFFFGSAHGPTAPNLSVFDNWIHESAYLAGIVAGSLTTNNMLGAVGGYPEPEVNRLLNAFLLGAHETAPEACLSLVYIDAWYDVIAAQNAAHGLIGDGADVLFAERVGAELAAEDLGVPVFLNISDLGHAPTMRVGTIEWNFHPTLLVLLDRLRNGSYKAEDYGQWSMLFAGGTGFQWNARWRSETPKEIYERVKEREAQIISGRFRVPVIEETPPACPADFSTSSEE